MRQSGRVVRQCRLSALLLVAGLLALGGTAGAQQVPGPASPDASADRRAVVLEDAGVLRRTDRPPLAPITVWVPAALQPRTLGPPFTNSVSVTVHYPSMRRWDTQEQRCFRGCPGRLQVTLEYGRESAAQARVLQYQSIVANTDFINSRIPGAAARYLRRSALPDYPAVLDEQDQRPNGLTLLRTPYLRPGLPAAVAEAAECDREGSRPECLMFVDLEDRPDLHLQLGIPAAQWEERGALRAAAIGLVRSFLNR